MANDPLILGAGPAGCAAAIMLGKQGFTARLLDRDAEVGDPLCGGFLSWRTAAQLHELGIDVAALGAHHVHELRLFRGDRMERCALPQAAFGLSRRALDTAMRAAAIAGGADLIIDTVRGFDSDQVTGASDSYDFDSLFLATGKHDVRGQSRPRFSDDPALGLRIRLPASPQRGELLNGAIELHLFDGGYAGVVLQEGASANICLALRKSALARQSNDPRLLMEELAQQTPALAKRLGEDWRDARVETIGAVPYGYIAKQTQHGIFRLGDQAAVIPSLAGEGISIALASGQMAAQHWREGGASCAAQYQRNFATVARRPVAVARLARKLAETRIGARAGLLAMHYAPAIIALMADATRIGSKSRLAPLAHPA